MALNGAPTKYTKKLADQICMFMAEGLSLREICRQESMPAMSTVMLWVATDRSGFSEQYAKAFQARAYYHAEELIEIADDGQNDWMERNGLHGEVTGYQVNGEAIARSRLRVDTRKWVMSKMIDRFSDKQQDKQAEGTSELLAKLIDKLPS